MKTYLLSAILFSLITGSHALAAEVNHCRFVLTNPKNGSQRGLDMKTTRASDGQMTTVIAEVEGGYATTSAITTEFDDSVAAGITGNDGAGNINAGERMIARAMQIMSGPYAQEIRDFGGGAGMDLTQVRSVHTYVLDRREIFIVQAKDGHDRSLGSFAQIKLPGGDIIAPCASK